MSEDTVDTSALELATELTIAWLGNPNTRISADEVPQFLRRMHETVSELTAGPVDQGGQPVGVVVAVRRGAARPGERRHPPGIVVAVRQRDRR